MELETELRVTNADRLAGAVIIAFSDGRCGLYSAALLHAMLSPSNEMFEQDTPEPFEREAGSLN